jgi:mannose-1-phosphate guanylyltransferase
MKFVILAGGTGKRLWPLSTLKKPKQFHSFLSDRTLYQEAFDRITAFAKPEDIFIATNQEHVATILEQTPEIPEENVIVEPSCRDTAACMSFATKYLETLFGPEETISIIYADQMIKYNDEFQEKTILGHKLAAEEDKMVIIEVKAKNPNTNYGYVKLGDHTKTENNIEIYELDHFTEKPDLENARKFVQSYKYLWNTGLYIWKIGTFLEYIQKFSPEIHQVLNSIQDFKNCPTEYNNFPKISLDYALMEKIDPTNVWIIPADLGWSDIGTWQTLFDELTNDDLENLTEGQVFQIDTEGSILINKQSDKKLTAINMKDTVIVNTPGSILVCPRRECKNIKLLLDQIKDSNKSDSD